MVFVLGTGRVPCQARTEFVYVCMYVIQMNVSITYCHHTGRPQSKKDCTVHSAIKSAQGGADRQGELIKD